MIKVSDYIFDFLIKKGIKECFMLPGGGAMHLIDSLGKSGMNYTCFQHEQGAACAAEAYGQHTNTPGFLLVTSGPGATNAITPVTAGWIDSTPMFVISGQAKTTDLVGDRKVRQTGSQEVPVIPMVSAVTKYAVEILEPSDIKYHLEKAWHESVSERKGPVWLSVPLDVQGAIVDESTLSGYEVKSEQGNATDIDLAVKKCIDLIYSSEKPLILAGNGIKLAGAEKTFHKLLKKIPVPVQSTWKSIDLIEETHDLYMGHPGIMGDRGANLFLQEADLLISIGSRIDTSLTAFDEKHFAKNAKKIIVDIDPNEIRRMNMEKAVAYAGDAGEFMTRIIEQSENIVFPVEEWRNWTEYGKTLRQKYPVVTKEHKSVVNAVSTYWFIFRLCDLLKNDDVIVPESSGGAGEITYQAFQLKRGQKMKNAAGLGSMGFGLPYAIGSCIANDKRRTVLINGDGAFQLNIQELETLKRLGLPVKIFILCNDGYASIRNMQNNNFENLVASSSDSGYTVPDVCRIAEAYGLPTFKISNNTELDNLLPQILETKGPVLCALKTDPSETVSPRVKAIPQPDGSMKSGKLENMWPEV